MARVALDHILLGQHGELQPGDEIPATWRDLDGTEHQTDFARLEDLGLVGDGKPAPAPAEEPPAEEPSDGLDELGVRDLRKLAKDRAVDLGKAKKKADIIAVLRAAASA